MLKSVVILHRCNLGARFFYQGSKTWVAVKRCQVGIPLHVTYISKPLIDGLLEVAHSLIAAAPDCGPASQIVQGAGDHFPVLAILGYIGKNRQQLPGFVEFLLVRKRDREFAHGVQSIRTIRPQNTASPFEGTALDLLGLGSLSFSTQGGAEVMHGFEGRGMVLSQYSLLHLQYLRGEILSTMGTSPKSRRTAQSRLFGSAD